MTKKLAADLTLEEIAMLADGSGIPDATAHKLAPLIRSDPRLTEPLAELHRMATDARVDCFEDAIKAHRELDQLAGADWRHPGEVLDPEAGIPYPELISVAGARAGRAAGAEKRRLLGILERLERAHAEYRAGEEFFQGTVDRLLDLDRGEAEAFLSRLTEHYRFRRKNPDWRPRED